MSPEVSSFVVFGTSKTEGIKDVSSHDSGTNEKTSKRETEVRVSC